MNRNGALQRFVIAAVPAAVFLCATVANLRLPGIQYDEVYYVPPAAALIKNQLDADYVMLDPSVIHLFGKPLPLMFNYYTSFFRTYLTLPVFALFGINVETIRGSSIALGVVSLIFFIAFARRLTRSSAIAFAAGLLLALDASFIAYVRNDFAVIATMMALKGVALWALLRWWQESDAKHLYLGVFFIGVGITDRASFLWIPMAIGATLILIYRKCLADEIGRRLDSTKKIFLACVSFGIGASVFLAFNIATRGGTFTPMAGSFGETSGGANNFALLENFYLRLQMLTEVLGGGYFNHFIAGEKAYQTTAWNFSGSPLSWLVPLAFVYFFIKMIAVRFDWFTRNTIAKIEQKPLFFIVSMIFVLLVLSCFTPTLHRGHQLLMLYPFPHLLVAIFVFDTVHLIAEKMKTRNITTTNVVCFIFVLMISAASARQVFAYHDMIKETGGRGAWSDAIYEIVEEVDRHPQRAVVCMDWGFNANILSLAKNPVRTIRNYYVDTRRSPEQLAGLFDERHTFLFHTPEYTLMPEPREDFSRAVALSGARVDTLRIFYQRDRKPLAFLVSALH
jgi:hypothetical protein